MNGDHQAGVGRAVHRVPDLGCLAAGIVLGLVSLFANVPMMVLVVIGSIAGAVGVTGGLMLLVGSLNSADFSAGDFTATVSNSFVWSLLLFVLAIGGIVFWRIVRSRRDQPLDDEESVA